jgi:hypothetical protein
VESFLTMAKACLTILFAIATMMTFPGFPAAFILVHIALQSPLYFMAEIGDDLLAACEFSEIAHGCDDYKLYERPFRFGFSSLKQPHGFFQQSEDVRRCELHNATNIKFYFAKPYHSWEQGTNYNQRRWGDDSRCRGICPDGWHIPCGME